jgi:hypothetical protein
MRTLTTLIAAVSIGSSAVGQSVTVWPKMFPVDSATGLITYTAVVRVDSATKDELYSRALRWYAATFPSASAAIDIGDRTSGFIESEDGVHLGAAYRNKRGGLVAHGRIEFKLVIECREGRYRYRLDEVIHRGPPCISQQLEVEKNDPMCQWQWVWDSVRGEASQSLSMLISSLKKAMETPPVGSSGDW